MTLKNQDLGVGSSIAPIPRTVDAAAGGNPALKQFLDGVAQHIELIHSQIGTNKHIQTNKKRAVAPPNLAKASLVLVDGKYVIDIVNPTFIVPSTRKQYNQKYDPDAFKEVEDVVILHQIQTSKNTLFDLSGAVTVYGGDNGSSLLHWEIHDPNISKFVRFRSRFSNSDWNGWQYANVSGACGAASLYTGVLSSFANNMVNQASTPSGANPLTQHGVTTQIDVASSVFKAGNYNGVALPTLNYNSGSVDPGAFGTYYIYAEDQKKVGGTVTYVASTNIADITATDTRIFFGRITTAMGGGGSGSGGGSGAGCPVGEVEVMLPDGYKKPWSAMRRGDQVLGADGDVETIQSIELWQDRPCFSIKLKNGVTHRGLTSDGLLQRASGEMGRVFELLKGDMMWSAKGNSRIASKTFLGKRTVYKIVLSHSRIMVNDGMREHNKAPI